MENSKFELRLDERYEKAILFIKKELKGIEKIKNISVEELALALLIVVDIPENAEEIATEDIKPIFFKCKNTFENNYDIVFLETLAKKVLKMTRRKNDEASRIRKTKPADEGLGTFLIQLGIVSQEEMKDAFPNFSSLSDIKNAGLPETSIYEFAKEAYMVMLVRNKLCHCDNATYINRLDAGERALIFSAALKTALNIVASKYKKLKDFLCRYLILSDSFEPAETNSKQDDLMKISAESYNGKSSSVKLINANFISKNKNRYIYGKSGSGKTTSLREAAITLFNDAIDLKRVSIFIEMNSNVRELINEIAKLAGGDRQYLYYLLKYGDIVIIIDGINQSDNRRKIIGRINDLLEINNNITFIISGQEEPESLSLPENFSYYKVRPLDFSEMRSRLEKDANGKRAVKLLDKNPGFRELCSTPFYFNIFKNYYPEFFSEKGFNKEKLLKAMVREAEILKEYKKICRLAFEMKRQKIHLTAETRWLKKLSEKFKDIIVPEKTGNYRFRHELIRDYFCAKELGRIDDDTFTSLFAGVEYSEWTGILELAGNDFDKARAINNIIKSAIENNEFDKASEILMGSKEFNIFFEKQKACLADKVKTLCEAGRYEDTEGAFDIFICLGLTDEAIEVLKKYPDENSRKLYRKALSGFDISELCGRLNTELDKIIANGLYVFSLIEAVCAESFSVRDPDCGSIINIYRRLMESRKDEFKVEAGRIALKFDLSSEIDCIKKNFRVCVTNNEFDLAFGLIDKYSLEVRLEDLKKRLFHIINNPSIFPEYHHENNYFNKIIMPVIMFCGREKDEKLINVIKNIIQHEFDSGYGEHSYSIIDAVIEEGLTEDFFKEIKKYFDIDVVGIHGVFAPGFKKVKELEKFIEYLFKEKEHEFALETLSDSRYFKAIQWPFLYSHVKQLLKYDEFHLAAGFTSFVHPDNKQICSIISSKLNKLIKDKHIREAVKFIDTAFIKPDSEIGKEFKDLVENYIKDYFKCRDNAVIRNDEMFFDILGLIEKFELKTSFSREIEQLIGLCRNIKYGELMSEEEFEEKYKTSRFNPEAKQEYGPEYLFFRKLEFTKYTSSPYRRNSSENGKELIYISVIDAVIKEMEYFSDFLIRYMEPIGSEYVTLHSPRQFCFPDKHDIFQKYLKSDVMETILAFLDGRDGSPTIKDLWKEIERTGGKDLEFIEQYIYKVLDLDQAYKYGNNLMKALDYVKKSGRSDLKKVADRFNCYIKWLQRRS